MKLGRTNLDLPAITFGAMAFGSSNEDVHIDTMRAAIDAGMTAIDTAPLYEFGGSEIRVGRAISGIRERVVVMTKCGLRWDGDGIDPAPRGEILFEFTDDHGARKRIIKDSRPDSIRAEVDKSLGRLRVDVIDLLQVHHPDINTPIAETMGVLRELKREGKIREIGVSNYSRAQLEEAKSALADVPLASVQLGYSALNLEAEQEILPWARENHVGVLAYSPLAQGLLTGRIRRDTTFDQDDYRPTTLLFRAGNREKIFRAIEEHVRPIAAEHQVTVAEVMLAWVVHQAGITSAIASARHRDQAETNARAARLVLTGDEMLRIRQTFAALPLDRSRTNPTTERLVRFVKRLLRRI